MADKTEMVLVSRDELQQLIGASVRCAFEEYQQVQAPQDTSEYYTIRQLAEKWGVSLSVPSRRSILSCSSGSSSIKPESVLGVTFSISKTSKKHTAQGRRADTRRPMACCLIFSSG